MNDFNGFNSRPDTGFDPETGEVLQEVIPPSTSRERTASGEVVSTIAHTGGGFLDLMEDGNFSHDAYEKMRALAAKMTDISNATGNPTKGKITLEIDLEKDGDAFRVRGNVKVKEPELPRPKSIMWTNDAGDFTRFPPNQTQMFGTPRTVRRV